MSAAFAPARPPLRGSPQHNQHGAPMADLNTTPLIDVMLVLLVMFIVTVPVSAHLLPIDLPQGRQSGVLSPVENRIVITRDGTILWNAQPVTRAQLRANLAAAAAMKPEPTTLFEPDGNAAYLRIAEVVHDVKGARITKFAFVGNDRYRAFSAD